MTTTIKILSILSQITGFLGTLTIIPGIPDHVAVWIALGGNIAHNAILAVETQLEKSAAP